MYNIISPAVVLFCLIAGFLWRRPMLCHVVTTFIYLGYWEYINIEPHFYGPFFFLPFLVIFNLYCSLCDVCQLYSCTVTSIKVKEFFIIITWPANSDSVIILNLLMLHCLMQLGMCFCYYSLVNITTTS